MPNTEAQLTLIYSCSGASSAAQMANYIAVKLDRMEVAEMSCIAGVGGDVKPLVKIAKSGRPIIVVDGCPLKCAANILKRYGIEADQHYDLSKMGVKKESLALTVWIKDMAPSHDLRKWFNHRPERWEAFRAKYREELKLKPEALKPLREAIATGPVTLVYSACDETLNQAVVLREFLLENKASAK